VRARTLQAVSDAVGGSVRGGPADVVVRGVTIDSRRVSEGDLFVALPGQHADGHAYAQDALRAGAAAALVGRDRSQGGPGPFVEVEDPGRALLDLAANERAAGTATVIGITGSTGKTCTKDFTAAVLSRRFRTVASRGSFNNEVGLPLTLLAAGEDTEVVVC
jgi:UDP-N-acetylmuramoyl-tripeptide--D-alanyl-D-alanine ligase